MNEKGEKNKIKIKTYINFFTTCHNTLLPYNRQYIVKKKKKGFSPSHEAWILVFGMINVKNLAFITFNASALTSNTTSPQLVQLCLHHQFHTSPIFEFVK